MNVLAPGPCFLVNLTEMEAYNGHVVDLTAGPQFMPDGTVDWWYSIDATWLREQFPNAPLFLAARHNLKPITPDGARDEAQQTQLAEHVK